jgi:hypothetical protein
MVCLLEKESDQFEFHHDLLVTDSIHDCDDGVWERTLLLLLLLWLWLDATIVFSSYSPEDHDRSCDCGYYYYYYCRDPQTTK